MTNVTFTSASKTIVYKLVPNGRPLNEGTTPGTVSFTLQTGETWLVVVKSAADVAEIAVLSNDLNQANASYVQVNKSNLVGADLVGLAGVTALRRMILSGGWTGADMAGVAAVSQLELLGLGNTQVDDQGIGALGPLINLQELVVSGTAITGVGLTALGGAVGLTKLNAFKTMFDDAGCQALAALPGLTDLNLLETAITDAGVTRIAQHCPTLENLFIDRNIGVTDASVAALQALTDLEHVSLDATGMSGAGVVALLSLPALRRFEVKKLLLDDADVAAILADRSDWEALGFGNRQITDAAFAAIGGQTSLTQLTVNCPKVGAAAVANIGQVSSLVDLDLIGCTLDNMALLGLYGLTNLRVLFLESTGGMIDTTGIADLQAALPNCEIVWDGMR